MLNIAFFLGELQFDSQSKVLNGMKEAAIKDGNNIYVYSLTLTKDEFFNQGEAAIIEDVDFTSYDGFVIYAESIYSGEIRHELITRILESGKPCASIDYPINGMINISSGNEEAMRELSKHLIEMHGIKTVNFIGGPLDSIDAITRKRVFEEELTKAGYSLDARRVYDGDYFARSGHRAVAYFEEQGVLEADAYVCANDQMALGAYYALESRGIHVPEDVLMSGYDGIFEAENHYPRITSVVRFEEKLGQKAYQNVVNCILHENYEKEILIRSKATFAQSCGCAMCRPMSEEKVINRYVDKKLNETRYAFRAKESRRLSAADAEIDALVRELIDNHTIG